jgi:cytochrome c oxidase assembly protein subunit 15
VRTLQGTYDAGVMRLSPTLYRKITFAALVSLYVIIVTGSLVRLTGSGLGCSDWPNCNDERFVDVSSYHAAIEQLNRLFTGVVGAAVILAVAGALIRKPRRRDLTWLSLSLVAGVLGQALVGAVVVWTHLHPVAVQQHFLLSMVILVAALTLHRRAAMADDEVRVLQVSEPTRRLVWAIATMMSLALITGTVVTGTGPHSGQFDDPANPDLDEIRRFGFAIRSVAEVHSITVLLTLGLTLYLVWRLRGTPDQAVLENPISSFLFLGFLQGGIGYLQYFTGVPVPLVAIHVALSGIVWLTMVHMVLVLRKPVTRTSTAEPQPLGTPEPSVR